MRSSPLSRRIPLPLALIIASTMTAGATTGCEATLLAGSSSAVEGSSDGTSKGDTWAVATLVVLLAAGVILTTVYIVADDDISAYYETNQRDIIRDIARGDGPFVRDVAGSLGLDSGETRQLGTALQRHHATLSEALALGEPVTAARIAAFGVALRRAIASAPALATYVSETHLTKRLDAFTGRAGASGTL